MTESGLLGARYELGEVIGHGGMAEVRLGQDTRLGRQVAVKTLRTDLATDPTFQARFRREAQSAASLNHPSIVAVYDTGEQLVGGVSVPYIVMEYVEGRTLRDVLREGRRLLPERALEITSDVLEALEYSHRAGIVHRDIKPANVMLTPAGDVKVMDFGIARAVADASATMTQTAAVIGTAQYLSPEQARGESVDARSDIYSTGCLLYELLTHSPPFTGDSPVSVAYQHVREEPRPPSMIDAEVSPEADAITLKALAKRPDDRYQSAGDMRADIERALAGQAVTVPVMAADATARFMPPSELLAAPVADANGVPDDTEIRARRRRRKWYIALAVLGALAIIGVTWAAVTLLSTGNDVENIAVPQLTNMTQSEAVERLEAEGFTSQPQIVEENNDEIEQGIVFAQDPDRGEFVAPNTEVTLTVSLGRPEVSVPDVLGQTVDDAREVLEGPEYEFTVATRADNNSDEPANIVTAVSPEVDAQVPTGATITLTYSAGLVDVPDVVGETEAQATATLNAAGFEVDSSTEVTTEADEGTVIHQAPSEGERRAPGETISIIVAVAPEPTEEPTTDEPTEEPTEEPTDEPTEEPTETSDLPTVDPTIDPDGRPDEPPGRS